MGSDTITLLQQARTHGEAAAIWWTSRIEKPTFDMDMPAPPQVEALTTRLTLMSMINKPDLVEFGVALADIVNKAMDDPQYAEDIYCGRPGLYLGTDYHPDGLLLEAAEAVNLNLISWPWKTLMWLSSTEIKVSFSGSDGIETIWVKPD